MSMNTEVKKIWTEALRSGEYKQGRGQLKTHNGEYCCLGVLCDLHCKATGKGEWALGSLNFYKTEGDHDRLGLPIPVQEWAGLYDRQPTVGVVTLAEFNDSGNSFEHIADLIEEHL